MKKKDILAIMTIAMMAVGCNSSDEVQQKSPVPIRLTASVVTEAVTRGADDKVIETDASTRGIQENALADNQKIYVWAKEDGSSSWDFLKAWTLTAGSTGLSGNAKYYPLDGSTITMNAVHGNFAETLTEDATTATSLTHSVKANQSDDYEVSDLLFGSATGSDASTTENIALTHKLSKIEVNLSPGYGYDATDLTSSVVTLNNVKPTITIDPTNGTLGTTATGTAVTITTRKDATTGTYEAVIPPQTFANPDALIAVTTTKDNLTLTSTVPNDVATYAENTRYVYNVTVNGGDPGLLANENAIDIGWVLGYNGKFYTSNEIASIFTTPIGVVVYRGTNASITESKGHGLVMALNNINNDATYTWTPNTTIATGYMDESFITNARSQDAIRGDYGGLSRTNTLATHACNSNHKHPVFEELKTWRENSLNAAPTVKGTTDWFIPSGGQWIAAIEAIIAFKGHTVPTYSTTWGHWSNNGEQDYLDIKSLLEAAGGTFPEGVGLGYGGNCALYASTSEYGSNGTYMGSIGFEFGNHTSSVAGTGFRTNFDYKPSPEFVRPFLAF